MGIVFGRTGVNEPAFTILSKHSPSSHAAFEVRSYAQRFAIETAISSENSGFRELAGFIGVGTMPKNEGGTAISMTAPVATKGGTAISMTAPVSTSSNKDGSKVMNFVLPVEYDSIEKIPKPTSEKVRVVPVPAAVGAVTAFSGWVKPTTAEEKKEELLAALKASDVTVEEPIEWELWQFNPPFTIPTLRRNEVWVKLTKEQAAVLEAKGEKI